MGCRDIVPVAFEACRSTVGEDGPDIDLLVVFEHIEPAEKRPMMARIRSAIETSRFAPVDVLVTDGAEMAERHDDVGSILY